MTNVTISEAVKSLEGGFDAFASSYKDKLAGLEDRIEGIEARKSTPGLTAAPAATKTIWQELKGNERLAQVATGAIRDSGEIKLGDGSLDLILKTLTSSQDALDGADVYPVRATRRDIFGNDARLALQLLQALPRIPVDSNSFEFPRLADEDREADYQATEGAVKGEMPADSTLITAPIQTIAHWIRASRQALGDVPQLQQQIESLLTYGVARRIERELVAGTGTGRNIEGIATAATAATVTATAAADRIGQAATALQVAGWDPNLVLMHPTDWFEMASERASDSQYVGQGWDTAPDGGVWGMQRILSTSLTAGTAIVLDRAQVAILDRQAATLIATAEGHENVSRNLVTMLAEVRLGLAIFSPAAIASVDISGV